MQVTKSTFVSQICKAGQNTGLIGGCSVRQGSWQQVTGALPCWEPACLVSSSSVVRCLGTAGGVARQYRKCVGVTTKDSIQTDMPHLSAVPLAAWQGAGTGVAGAAWRGVACQSDHQVFCYPVAAETWGIGRGL